MADLETKIKEMRRLSFNEAARWGAIVGGVASLLLLLSYLLRENENFSFINSMDFVVFCVLFYMAAKEMAKKRGNFGFSFTSAWGFVILVSAFGGVLSGVMQYVLMAHINPAYYTNIYMDMFRVMYGEQAGSTYSDLFNSYKDNVAIIVISSIIGSAFRGAFVGLIVAAFTRNRINPYKGYTKSDPDSSTES